MKKFILITTVASVISGSAAFAKTEGNIVGLNILRASASNQYQKSGSIAANYSKFDDSAIGFGASYKYAFNFNQIFVAPGVFFDKLGLKAKDQDGDTVSSSYRYGAKADLGYDVTEDFSAYLTAGVANTNYKVDWKTSEEKKSGTKLGYIAGVGVAYKVAKNLIVSLEYNMQSPTFKTPDHGGINEVKSKIKVAQIGVAYNF